MKIKAIFVDLGGVLVVNEARKIKDKYELQHGLQKSVVSKIFRYLQTTDRSEEEIDKILTKNNIDRGLWDQYCAELFGSEKKNEGLYTILQKAQKSGKLVVYTTNNSEALVSLMEKFEIKNFADLVINSTKFGVTKPEDNFWNISLFEAQKLRPNLRAFEVLVIDDSEVNYSSALKNGMQAILYRAGKSDKKLNQILD